VTSAIFNGGDINTRYVTSIPAIRLRGDGAGFHTEEQLITLRLARIEVPRGNGPATGFSNVRRARGMTASYLRRVAYVNHQI